MSIILDVANTPTFDNRITKIELHTYNPYANTTFDNSDEIRIPIQQQDLYTLPCESFLYIEGRGTLTAQTATGPATSTTAVLDNNCVAFMFDEIRYELNGVEIDRCRNPGITTTLKNYVSLSADRSKVLANAGWNYAIDYDNDIFHSGAFNFCVPLNVLLGFCEDYKHIVMNARHELILIRSRVDTNVMHCTSATAWPKLEIRKVQWRMPHVVLEEVNKLSMLRILESGRPIAMSFRSWSLHEYPLLQATTKHTWTVKATSQIEKPRYVLFGTQTDRKNCPDKSASRFDSNNLTNLRLYLNSEAFPYDDLNLDFDRNKYALLYDMYAKFGRSYYGHGEPLLNAIEFHKYAPIAVIDCSRQNESLKSATVDVRIDFEFKENVPANTTAYCLMIHDRIVEYNPLTNVVRKLI